MVFRSFPQLLQSFNQIGTFLILLEDFIRYCTFSDITSYSNITLCQEKVYRTRKPVLQHLPTKLYPMVNHATAQYASLWPGHCVELFNTPPLLVVLSIEGLDAPRKVRPMPSLEPNINMTSKGHLEDKMNFIPFW